MKSWKRTPDVAKIKPHIPTQHQLRQNHSTVPLRPSLHPPPLRLHSLSESHAKLSTALGLFNNHVAASHSSSRRSITSFPGSRSLKQRQHDHHTSITSSSAPTVVPSLSISTNSSPVTAFTPPPLPGLTRALSPAMRTGRALPTSDPVITVPIRTDWQTAYLRKRRRRRRRKKRRKAVRPAQLYRRPPTEDEEFMSDHERMVYYSRRYRLGPIENAEPYGTPMMEKFGFRFDTHLPTYAPQEGDIKQMQEILERADDELAFNRPYVKKYRDYKEAAYAFVPHTADETGLYAKNVGDFFTVPFKYRFTKWYQDAVDNYNRLNETRIIRKQKEAIRLSFDHVRRRNWFQRTPANPTSWHIRAFLHQRFPMGPIIAKRWTARILDMFLWLFPIPKSIRYFQKSTGVDSRLVVSSILLLLLLALFEFFFHPKKSITDKSESVPVVHDYDAAINSETRRYLDRMIEVETAYVYAKSLLDMHKSGMLEDANFSATIAIPAELAYRLPLPDSVTDEEVEQIKAIHEIQNIQEATDDAALAMIYPGSPKLRGGVSALPTPTNPAGPTPSLDAAPFTLSKQQTEAVNESSSHFFNILSNYSSVAEPGPTSLPSASGDAGFLSVASDGLSSSAGIGGMVGGGGGGGGGGSAHPNVKSTMNHPQPHNNPSNMVVPPASFIPPSGDAPMQSDDTGFTLPSGGGGSGGGGLFASNSSDDDVPPPSGINTNQSARQQRDILSSGHMRSALGDDRLPAFAHARETRQLGSTMTVDLTLKQFLEVSALQLENELMDYKKYFARRAAPVTYSADNFYNVVSGTYLTLLNRDTPSFTPLLSSLHQAMIDFGVRLKAHEDSSSFPIVRVDQDFINRNPVVEVVEEHPIIPEKERTQNEVIDSIQDYLDEEIFPSDYFLGPEAYPVDGVSRDAAYYDPNHTPSTSHVQRALGLFYSVYNETAPRIGLDKILGSSNAGEKSMSKTTPSGTVITVTDVSEDDTLDGLIEKADYIQPEAPSPPRVEYSVRLPFIPQDLSSYTPHDYHRDMVIVQHIKSCKRLEETLPEADHLHRRTAAYDLDTLRGDSYGEIGRSISSQAFATLQQRFSQPYYKKALELELEVMTQFKDYMMARYRGTEPVWISAVNPVKLVQWKDYVAGVASQFYHQYILPLPTRLNTPLLPLPGEKASMGYETKLSDTLESQAAHVHVPEFLRLKLANVYNPRTLDEAPKPLTFDTSIHRTGDSELSAMRDLHYTQREQLRSTILHKLQFNEVSKRRNWKEWQQYKVYRNTIAGHRMRTIMEHDRWKLNPWFLKAMRAPPRDGYLPPQIQAWSMFIQEMDSWKYYLPSSSKDKDWSVYSGSSDKIAAKTLKRLYRVRGNRAYSTATQALEITKDAGRARILQRSLVDEKRDLIKQLNNVPVLALERFENISAHIQLLSKYLHMASPQNHAVIQQELQRLQEQLQNEEDQSQIRAADDVARISLALSDVEDDIRTLFQGKLQKQYLHHKEARIEHWNEAVHKESERRAILRLGQANREYDRFTHYQKRGQRISNILMKQGDVDAIHHEYRDYHEQRLLEAEEEDVKAETESVGEELDRIRPFDPQFTLNGSKSGLSEGSYVPFLSRRERDERQGHDLTRAYDAISRSSFDRLDFQHDEDVYDEGTFSYYKGAVRPNHNRDKVDPENTLTVYQQRLRLQKQRFVNQMVSQAIKLSQRDLMSRKSIAGLTDEEIRAIEKRTYEKLCDYRDWLSNPDKWVQPPRSYHQVAVNSGIELDRRVREARKKRVERLWKGENISSHEWAEPNQEIDRFFELIRAPPEDPDHEPYYALLLEAQGRAKAVFKRLQETPKNEQQTERFMQDLDQAVSVLEYFDPQTYHVRETGRIASDDDAFSFSRDSDLIPKAVSNEIYRFSAERAHMLQQGRIQSMQQALKVAMVNEEKRAALRLQHGGHRPEDAPKKEVLRHALHFPLYKAEADRTEVLFPEFKEMVYESLLMKGQGDLVDPNSQMFAHTCRFIYNIDRYLSDRAQFDRKNPIPMYKIRSYRAHTLDVDTLKALVPYVEDSMPPPDWPALEDIDKMAFDTSISHQRKLHNDEDALTKHEAYERRQARDYYKRELEMIENPSRLYKNLSTMAFTKHQDDIFSIHDFIANGLAFGSSDASALRVIPQRGKPPKVIALDPSTDKLSPTEFATATTDGLIQEFHDMQQMAIDEFLAGVPQFDERRVKALAQQSKAKRAREVRLDKEIALHPHASSTVHPPYREYAKNSFELNDNFTSKTLQLQHHTEARLIGMTQQYHQKRKDLLQLKQNPRHVIVDTDDPHRNNPIEKTPQLLEDQKRKQSYKKYYSYGADSNHPDVEAPRDQLLAYDFNKQDRSEIDNYMLNHPRYETTQNHNFSFNDPQYQPQGTIIPKPDTKRRPLLKEQISDAMDHFYDQNHETTNTLFPWFYSEKEIREHTLESQRRLALREKRSDVPTPISYRQYNPEYDEQEANTGKRQRSEADSNPETDLTYRDLEYYYDNQGNKVMRPSLARRPSAEVLYFDNHPITDTVGRDPFSDDPESGSPSLHYDYPDSSKQTEVVLQRDNYEGSRHSLGHKAFGQQLPSPDAPRKRLDPDEQNAAEFAIMQKRLQQRKKTARDREQDALWEARKDWVEGVVSGRYPNPYSEQYDTLVHHDFSYAARSEEYEEDDVMGESDRIYHARNRLNYAPHKHKRAYQQSLMDDFHDNGYGDGYSDDGDDDDDNDSDFSRPADGSWFPRLSKKHTDDDGDDDDDDEIDFFEFDDYMDDRHRGFSPTSLAEDLAEDANKGRQHYNINNRLKKPKQEPRMTKDDLLSVERRVPIPSVLFGNSEAEELIKMREQWLTKDDDLSSSAYYYHRTFEDYTNMRTAANSQLIVDTTSLANQMRATSDERFDEYPGLHAYNFYRDPTLLQAYHDSALKEEIKLRREAYEHLVKLDAIDVDEFSGTSLLPHEREAVERHLAAAKELCKLRFELPRSDRKLLEERIESIENKIGPDHEFSHHELEKFRQKVSKLHLNHEFLKAKEKQEQAFEKFKNGQRLEGVDQYHYLAHEANYLIDQIGTGNTMFAGFYNNPTFKKLNELLKIPSHEARSLLDRALLTMEFSKRERDGLKWLIFNYDRYQSAVPAWIIDNHIDVYEHHMRDMSDFTSEEILDAYDIQPSEYAIQTRYFRPQPLGPKVNSFATNIFDSYRIAVMLEIWRIDPDFKPLPQFKIHFPAVNNTRTRQEQRLLDKKLSLLHEHGIFTPTVEDYNPEGNSPGTDPDQLILMKPHQKHLFSLMFYNMNPFTVDHHLSVEYSQRKAAGTEEFVSPLDTRIYSYPMQLKIDHVKQYNDRQQQDLTNLYKEMEVEDTLKLAKGEEVDWKARDQQLQSRFAEIHHTPQVNRLRNLVQIPIHMM